MRELVYYVATSIDGYIAAPDGTYDAFPIVGDHMDVQLGEFADALPAHVAAALGVEPRGDRFDTVIQGWNSYRVALDVGIERPYAHLREYVATSRRDAAPQGVTYTADALATVRELKQEDGAGIYLCGGGRLAGSLLPEIDRLILKRSPVVFGAGIPLFGDVPYAAAEFRPVSTQSFDSGVQLVEYARAG
ncbi:dihydrofolate reductase family protein [Streptomyces bohaiensis]|uniref:Dihydrofolate reductase n=1 Tax=Streptomyces bohaiensis TaxID=1431344 RepID=A0ABX1C6W5_9ACTN|nr:dihydrofolate reductase family protein [Streptomyces bohaiensis]NJQ14723.1 dihydrofolate reductase [Streptomyces bohaiensis]